MMAETPLGTDYRDSHQTPGKGESYDAAFREVPYRRMVWRMEQRVLDAMCERLFGSKTFSHLDFACGTGRILAHISPRTRESVGIDVSPEMLAVARRAAPSSELILGDLSRDHLLDDRTFDLVTAFRFFPNAQPELRREALRAIARRTRRDGYVIFNNHRNSGSIRHRVRRLIRRPVHGMSMRDVRHLIDEAGMEMVAVSSLCVFPASERHPLLPVTVIRPIDEVCSRFRPFRSLGENLVYVCRPRH